MRLTVAGAVGLTTLILRRRQVEAADALARCSRRAHHWRRDRSDGYGGNRRALNADSPGRDAATARIWLAGLSPSQRRCQEHPWAIRRSGWKPPHYTAPASAGALKDPA